MKTKKFRVDKEIALLLVRAQNASNGGKTDWYHKRIPRCPISDMSLHQWDFSQGYEIKDVLIQRACDLISKNKSSFSFSVQYSDRKTRRAKTLIYFSFKIDGEKHQISFHSLDRIEFWGGPKTWNNEAHKVRWTRDYSSSRRAAEALIKAYGLNYTL